MSLSRLSLKLHHYMFKRRRGIGRWVKRQMAKSERQRTRRDPECPPQYKRFRGYWW